MINTSTVVNCVVILGLCLSPTTWMKENLARKALPLNSSLLTCKTKIVRTRLPRMVLETKWIASNWWVVATGCPIGNSQTTSYPHADSLKAGGKEACGNHSHLAGVSRHWLQPLCWWGDLSGGKAHSGWWSGPIPGCPQWVWSASFCSSCGKSPWPCGCILFLTEQEELVSVVYQDNSIVMVLWSSEARLWGHIHSHPILQSSLLENECCKVSGN